MLILEEYILYPHNHYLPIALHVLDGLCTSLHDTVLMGPNCADLEWIATAARCPWVGAYATPCPKRSVSQYFLPSSSLTFFYLLFHDIP